MIRYPAILLAVVALGGCATQAATSGRVVLQDSDNVVDVRITDRDRRVIEGYYRNAAGKKRLPPGLAKRSDGLPPGLRKRDKLPPGLQGEMLPAELERLLASLPSTYVRLRVGADVVLLHRQTRVIVDVLHGVAGQ